MPSTRNRVVLALVMPVLLFLTACGVNSIPTAQEIAKQKWADLQAAYQRRLDSLPALAQTVTAAAGHETNLQVGVAQARTAATNAQVSPDQLTDPAAVQRFAEAQQAVSNLIIRVTQEMPPENRANENYHTLMDQIEGSNNRITVAIRDYNEAVRDYNTRIRTFPDVIGARVIYGSQPMVPFQAQAGAETMPTLNVGNGQ
jgi:LemA protein